MTAVAFRGRWNPGTSTQDSTSSYQTFTYDTVDVDTHSFHTGSGIITIPANGIYLIHATWSGVGNTNRAIQIRKNGSSIRGNAMGASNGSDNFTCTANWVGCLNAGDQIDVRGSSTSTISTTFGYTHIARIPLPFVHAVQNGDVSGSGVIGYAETSDIEGWHNPADPTKFTVTQTGDYVISAGGRSVGGALGINVQINGSPSAHYAVGVGFDRDPSINTVIPLTAGDYVQVSVDSSAATNDRDGSPNHFAMWKLPAAAHVATRDTSNTTTSAGGTRMPLAIEDADTDGFHSGSSTQLTVPSGKAGTYLVMGGFYMNYGVVVQGWIVLNNEATGWYSSIVDFAQHSGGTNSPDNCGVITLAAGDYVELQVYTGSTGQTASDVRLAMVRLDDLTYVPQICPGDPVTFVPQIVRYR